MARWSFFMAVKINGQDSSKRAWPLRPHQHTHSPKHNTLNWTGNTYTVFWVWQQMKHQMTSLGRLSSTTSLVLLSSSWIKYINPLLFSFAENTWSEAQQNLKILTAEMLCDYVTLNNDKYVICIKPVERTIYIYMHQFKCY